MKFKAKAYFMLTVFSLLLACHSEPTRLGRLERLLPEMDSLFSPDARLEMVASGFDWVEGPLWCDEQQMLLFSDIPRNRIYRWNEKDGVSVYLEPSGFTGRGTRKGELGSNGLALDEQGRLLLCQHGDRRMARMDAPLDGPEPKFITLADTLMGRRLNSPNDLVLATAGDIYFTDPPYGLEQQEKDSAKELPFQGVYRIRQGKCELLVDSLSRPNGIGLMPGEKQLVISNSDAAKPVWYRYDISDSGLANGRILARAPADNSGVKGLPDGLAIDRQGHIFATGPGGVFVFDKNGRLLGKIHFPEACSNVALADNEKTLWITADMYLLRVKMRP